MATHNFTTGPANLPDVGTLSYNGCVFSPLFTTEVSGTVVKDEANRTTKFMEYSIKVDGYVTLPDDSDSISPTMFNLRRLLSVQGGVLIYSGRGMDLIVNGGAGIANTHDVAWGPVPEVLEFQPLGAGRAAKIVWRVKTRIPEQTQGVGFKTTGPKSKEGDLFGNKNQGGVKRGGIALPMLQFNYSTNVTYGEDGYSTLSVNGSLEIPLTRFPNQKTRTLQNTADDLRGQIDTKIMNGIDLTKFRVTQRSFNLSNDKRTLSWDIKAEEKPYMDLPAGCTKAMGSFNIRPSQQGMGLCKWLCTLRATYTVRADAPRRVAWLSFLALLRLRMGYARKEFIDMDVIDNDNAPKKLTPLQVLVDILIKSTAAGPIIEINKANDSTNRVVEDVIKVNKRKETAAFLMDFNVDEGLYLDSKTTTFSATWMLITRFSHILLGSGLWRKVPEVDVQGTNIWATTMKDINGSESWLDNRVNPNLDIIVDFGS